MSDLYYGSAAEAGSDLALPLLLVASPSAAVPHHGERLSDFAPEIFEGARLFHRLPLAADLSCPAIWVTGPNGTTEYVVWAVGCAEHAARSGRAAYLIDLDPAHPLRVLAPGEGHSLPRSILERIRGLGLPGAAAWATDLQGVRLVLPTEAASEEPTRPEHGRAIVVFAQALPQEGEGSRIPPGAIEGVCFAAAIRDHTREELRGAVESLRGSGHKLLGFVAMGPTPVSRQSPLERWERVAAPSQTEPITESAPAASLHAAMPEEESPPVSASVLPPTAIPVQERSIGEPSTPETRSPSQDLSPDARTAAARPAKAAAPRAVEPAVLTPVEPPVSLVADWERRGPARPRTWLLVLLGITIAIAALAVWIRSTGRGPAELLSGIRLMKGIKSASGISPDASGPRTGSNRAPSESGEAPEGNPPAMAESARGLPSAPAGMQEETRSDGSYRLPSWNPGPADSAGAPRIPRTPEAWEHLSPRNPPAGAESGGPTPDVRAARQEAGGEIPSDAPVAGSVSDSLSVDWPDTFVVHVSSFRRSQDAETEVARLKASGVPARAVTVILPERGRWHRVIVGAYPDSTAASREAAILRAGGLVSFTQIMEQAGRGVGHKPVPR